ncbi:hypothetical protein IHQ68_13740 [Chelatococcus sambhunathii]|uniref:TAT (Twin-arginine translocation) pathway signal sequence n=1 Tax=Chelatococcus sambhunathii TaxID=363953 RepID=A0ABU1DHU0_9HYPH|nr:hypothetical protein [Chelatococcus sambhunathii]MDR4307680.1 hypothetical protein [Chelatococcus sambhunathii]
MNRRGFIAGAAVAPIAAGSAYALSPEILTLIENHKAAARAFNEVVGRRNECEEAYREAFPDWNSRLANSFLGAGYQRRQGLDFCLSNISAGYDARRGSTKYLARLSPAMAEQIRALLDAKEAENLEAARRQFDDDEAEREAFGLAPLERLVTAADDAEKAAALALCSYRCETIEEVRARAAYLRTAEILRDGLSDEQTEALIASGA